MLGVLIGALFFGYMSMPGDNTGLPYPTTEEEIRIGIGAYEEFLAKTEYEFALLEARYNVVRSDAPFSSESFRIGWEYICKKRFRKGMRYRIENFKKLLRKYEEIDSDFNRRGIPPDGVRGTEEEPQNSMAVDDGTAGNANPE